MVLIKCLNKEIKDVRFFTHFLSHSVYLAWKINCLKIELLLKQQWSCACEPAYSFELLSGFSHTGRKKIAREIYFSLKKKKKYKMHLWSACWIALNQRLKQHKYMIILSLRRQSLQIEWIANCHLYNIYKYYIVFTYSNLIPHLPFSLYLHNIHKHFILFSGNRFSIFSPLTGASCNKFSYALFNNSGTNYGVLGLPEAGIGYILAIFFKCSFR